MQPGEPIFWSTQTFSAEKVLVGTLESQKAEKRASIYRTPPLFLRGSRPYGALHLARPALFLRGAWRVVRLVASPRGGCGAAMDAAATGQLHGQRIAAGNYDRWRGDCCGALFARRALGASCFAPSGRGYCAVAGSPPGKCLWSRGR